MAKNYKRRMGDRRDGRLLRSLPAFSKFTPYIMPTRNDACNYYEESFEVSTVDRRLRLLADELADDQRVHGVVQLLEEEADGHRKGKADHVHPDIPLGHILIHPCQIITSPFP